MEVYEAILSRRSIKHFTSAPVEVAAIDRALAAGIWAQNHHLTQPWRFSVLGPQAHRALATANGAVAAEAVQVGDDAMRERVRAGAEAKYLSKPLIVVVSCVLHGSELDRREDFAATCCAIQNIQLAAWDEGLGMQWSSNNMTRHPRAAALLGINPAEEEIIAFLYFGYPAETPPAQPRKALDDVTRRLP